FVHAGLGLPNACTAPDGYDSAYVAGLINQYYYQYVAPTNGHVEISMRTFAGNETPAEGPKGVFDVTGSLIGNTVDGTQMQINQSFAQIWNSRAVDSVVGHLTALTNGHFQLDLRPGQQTPCQGVIGQR